MSDIVEFLRAQLAEEQRLWELFLAAEGGGLDSWGDIGAADQAWAAHQVDPAADIASKLAIVDLHDECGLGGGYCDDGGRGGAGPNCDLRGCGTLELLAQPYAGRDGWDEAWRRT